MRDHSLSWLWHQSPAFQAFRGDSWMREPCRSCDERERDFGGCRCQAMLLTGDARNTDPACSKSPHHGIVRQAIAQAEQPRTGCGPLIARDAGFDCGGR